MIGNVELCFGLYLLKSDTPSIKQGSKVKCVQSKSLSSCHFTSIQTSSVNKDNEILMYTPSFMYLENLFPKLFINKNPISFHCEVCQLSKHTCNTYSHLIYKPSSPFTLIHSDV